MPAVLAATPTPAPTPSASAAARALEQALARLEGTTPPTGQLCLSGDGSACGLLREWGLSQAWARAVVAYGAPLLHMLLVVAVGLALRWLLQRAISGLVERIATGESRPGRNPGRAPRKGLTAVLATVLSTAQADDGPDGPGGTTGLAGDETAPPVGTVAWERRAQRARTIGSVLSSLTTGVIGVTVVLAVLGEIGIDLAPLLAGAGVVGVAVGFGAQTLVKDFLSGIFLIAEDQYGVGDVIDLGAGTSGTVEAVGLRVTRLRSVDGTVWYVRNGDVVRVGNRAQGWARAVLDTEVGWGEDVERVQALLAGVGEAFAADPAWREEVLEPPEVWGVESLSTDTVVVRLVVKTAPLQQWRVSRELRRRIKVCFDEAGIGAAPAA